MQKLIFETERLIIREVENADLDSLFAICGNDELMKYTDNGAISKELTKKWIEVSINNYATKGYGMSAVIYKANMEFIGYCGLVYSKDVNDYELIYAIRKEYWGQQLTTEMAAQMLWFGFETIKLKTIFTSIDPNNLASKKILLKLGFTELYTKDGEFGNPTIYYEKSSL
ncbi:GNAT family N-acetyltransferase [Niastella caeni]|uniref:GNAT family N-acetyltransferase n=1 Tax=Niastella caeni TaxID=2569763 RepID=A0A4S8HVX6_9BACT|nr:GNAT family N-acetyltransferase [Niastella caeni]THU38204.1 GNAT family N-acetyltransferase [Niastella caeni]